VQKLGIDNKYIFPITGWVAAKVRGRKLTVIPSSMLKHSPAKSLRGVIKKLFSTLGTIQIKKIVESPKKPSIPKKVMTPPKKPKAPKRVKVVTAEPSRKSAPKRVRQPPPESPKESTAKRVKTTTIQTDRPNGAVQAYVKVHKIVGLEKQLIQKYHRWLVTEYL
jgi:hypothetical protein